MHQEQLDAYKRQCQQKFEKEKRMFEEEKRRKLKDIQMAIEKLNIASSDKERLKDEVDELNKEQRQLQSRIDDLERELEGQKSKKRAAEREINEINIQIN